MFSIDDYDSIIFDYKMCYFYAMRKVCYNKLYYNEAFSKKYF